MIGLLANLSPVAFVSKAISDMERGNFLDSTLAVKRKTY